MDTRESTTAELAIAKLVSREAVVGVLGLGYAGLPLACAFAEAGFRTFGFDTDPNKVEKLRRGESYISSTPAGEIERLVRSGALTPRASAEDLANCDVAVICVPTPLAEDGGPDLRFVIGTTREVRSRLHRGQLVVLESTTYPGTTDEVMLPILAESGLTVGRDFFLAYSPERVDPANQVRTIRMIPKLIGGVTNDCLRVATAAYSAIVDRVVPVSSARVAEAAKLLENIYRSVNVAVVNELKLLFERMELDIWEVIGAASTKPFGFTPFYPGPGLGGHCIPIDPFYLSWKARQYDFTTRLIELAGEINSAMPEHVVDRLAQALAAGGRSLEGADILLLGVAYKRDIEDVRESPALRIINLLNRAQARVRYHDPHVPRLVSRHLEAEMSSIELTAEVLKLADAVMIVTDHSAIDYEFVLHHARLVVNTRNATARYRKPGHKVILA